LALVRPLALGHPLARLCQVRPLARSAQLARLAQLAQLARLALVSAQEYLYLEIQVQSAAAAAAQYLLAGLAGRRNHQVARHFSQIQKMGAGSPPL